MNADAAADTEHLFVINLCASTSPMALSHPNTPELKRYTFFVSRQREEGRERFRLHMGYFASQEQAEALLAAVRDVYPAAWAGPAPTTGVPRRARMSVAPTITVTPRAAAPAEAAPAAAVALPQPAVATAPVAAAPVAAAPVAAAPVKNPAPVNPPAAAQAGSLDEMSNVRDVLAQLSESAPRLDAAAKAAPLQVEVPVAAAAAPRAPASELDASQTLSVLESAPAASPRPTPEPAAVRVAAPAAPAPVPATARAAAPAPAPAPAAAPPRSPAKARPASRANGADDGQVRIVTPEDTQTLTDIRLDAENNAPPCFAVQLIWAVAPIDVSALPHLAIFDAYTLYNVEGSRQGRKWFGLRLGFFSDPNSATQVAHYVRSDYPAVAVVPVATRERDHANGGSVPFAPRAAAAVAPLRAENALPIEKEGLNGFELLQDDAPRAAKRDVDDIGAQQQPAAAQSVPGAASMTAREKIAAAAAGKPLVKSAAPVVQAVAGKATGKPSGKRVVVRKRPPAAVSSRAAPGAPNPLESTLDILGASTLTLDESREIVNDSVIRKPIEKKSGSRFSKLLSRLSGG